MSEGWTSSRTVIHTSTMTSHKKANHLSVYMCGFGSYLSYLASFMYIRLTELEEGCDLSAIWYQNMVSPIFPTLFDHVRISNPLSLSPERLLLRFSEERQKKSDP